MDNRVVRAVVILMFSVTVGAAFYFIAFGELKVAQLLGVAVVGIIVFVWMSRGKPTRVKDIQICCEASETILKEGFARKREAFSTSRGKLALTERRIIYRSYQADWVNRQESFDFSSIRIAHVEGFLFENYMLVVTTRDGVTHRFILPDAEEWRSQLLQVMP